MLIVDVIRPDVILQSQHNGSVTASTPETQRAEYGSTSKILATIHCLFQPRRRD